MSLWDEGQKLNLFVHRKTWFFYVVFNAELNCAIRFLCFRRTIIDLLWPIMARRKCKILMVPFNSAGKNYIEEYGFLIRGTKIFSFCLSSHSDVLYADQKIKMRRARHFLKIDLNYPSHRAGGYQIHTSLGFINQLAVSRFWS